jgi:hypothetical protein
MNSSQYIAHIRSSTERYAFHRRTFDHFFNKGTTLAKIKDAALGDKLFPSSIPSNGFIGIAGRSIAWKVRCFPSGSHC